MFLRIFMTYAIPVAIASAQIKQGAAGGDSTSTKTLKQTWIDKSGAREIVLSATKSMTVSNGAKFFSVLLEASACFDRQQTKKIDWEYRASSGSCFEDNDFNAQWIEKSFRLTDLDTDGICEVWIMYKMSCRTDISPANLVLVMHEGKKEYLITGHTRVGRYTPALLGGDYRLDENFRRGNETFRDYAIKLWDEFDDEDFK
jgi:hypothetical protein